MSDRLEEIKTRVALAHTRKPDSAILVDFDWLIAEVERLRAQLDAQSQDRLLEDLRAAAEVVALRGALQDLYDATGPVLVELPIAPCCSKKEWQPHRDECPWANAYAAAGRLLSGGNDG